VGQEKEMFRRCRVRRTAANQLQQLPLTNGTGTGTVEYTLTLAKLLASARAFRRLSASVPEPRETPSLPKDPASLCRPALARPAVKTDGQTLQLELDSRSAATPRPSEEGWSALSSEHAQRGTASSEAQRCNGMRGQAQALQCAAAASCLLCVLPPRAPSASSSSGTASWTRGTRPGMPATRGTAPSSRPTAAPSCPPAPRGASPTGSC